MCEVGEATYVQIVVSFIMQALLFTCSSVRYEICVFWERHTFWETLHIAAIKPQTKRYHLCSLPSCLQPVCTDMFQFIHKL